MENPESKKKDERSSSLGKTRTGAPSDAVDLENSKDLSNACKAESEKRTDNVNDKKSREIQTDETGTETAEQLKNQLDMLMNSLATLSAEKSKMEANFQIDKKQMRSERDECEKVIKDLKDKLRKAQNHNYTELEHVKCKLIMERHEREKEQADHSKVTKDLQKLLYDERRTKEQLEAQLKSQFANKTQCKILEAELEITRNKLKQAEAAAKETPPILLSLQSEMAVMKKQHINAIHEEQKRAANAEQQARALAMTHEARVAGLEGRLAELSDIVGGYDRLRQQDQQAIQKLKNQLASLQGSDHNDHSTIVNEPEEIISKIKMLYNQLLDLDNKKSDSAHVKSLLNSLGLWDRKKYTDYKEQYDSLLQEFEDFKEQAMYKHHSMGSISQIVQHHNQSTMAAHDKDNNKTQLHLLKAHNSNLEERIRILNNEMMNKEVELKMKFERQQKLFQEERAKLEHLLAQKDNEYRSKISTLEQQLLRQRERSMALVEEKDKEILTLKSSFQALLPKKHSNSASAENKLEFPKREGLAEPTVDLVTDLITVDSRPFLHYTQELSRKEVQVSMLRKKILELEATVREKQRDIVHVNEKHMDETKKFQAYITRLEACKSREGANLEYLKNVFINYLTTNDISSKRHMLNAISTVLRFTPDELNKIKH
ncbi:hypothetical protein KM043_003655 [Ampulex compressa]|nr:hypothetical protein KM043_003655 [Ampulex compressa]